MNALAIVPPESPADNLVPLLLRKRARQAVQRFKVQEYTNPRTTSVSWRVTGMKRDGVRVRENYKDEPAAQCRQIELETEYLQGHAETAIQATKLNPDQLRFAESAFLQLGDDWRRILDAVLHWKEHGKRTAFVESPRIDDAIDQYLKWLETTPFRPATKRNWKFRMGVFKNSVANLRVAEVTRDTIREFLKTRKTAAAGKDTDKRAVSRFFSWCMEDDQRWISANPCQKLKIDMGESTAISVLRVDQCKKLLQSAEAHKDGLLVPYVAVCLFAGLRPFEAARLPWSQVNLKDGEIKLDANQTKTGRKSKQGRTIEICDNLKQWLRAYKGVEFYPANWRKEFDAVRESAGIAEWPHDIMRHTAISHHFRKHKSFGAAAEQFGNSESIIKKHYKSNVTSVDTKKFYALAPKAKAKAQKQPNITSAKA